MTSTEQLRPNTVFFRPSSTTEDSDPSGWVVAYSPDGRIVERTWGVFGTEEIAREVLDGVGGPASFEAPYDIPGSGFGE